MDINKKIASLHIGSNFVMLLLISHNKMGQIKILDEFGGLTKLGEGLKESKTLNPKTIKETIDLCKEITDIAYKGGAEEIIATTSSIIRNAMNKTEFLVACHSHFNIFPQVLTYSEEANYIFTGATYDYENLEGDIIVLEVGGDLVNILFGTKNMLVGLHTLPDIGFLPLTKKFTFKNKFFRGIQSPIKKHIKRASAEAIREIKSWLGDRQPTIICCGGTATTFASICSNQNYSDRHQINKMICPIDKARIITKKLGKMSVKDREVLLGIEHERAEYIHTSTYTMYTLLKQLAGKTDKFHITTNGLRTGILMAYIEKSNFLT